MLKVIIRILIYDDVDDADDAFADAVANAIVEK